MGKIPKRKLKYLVKIILSNNVSTHGAIRAHVLRESKFRRTPCSSAGSKNRCRTSRFRALRATRLLDCVPGGYFTSGSWRDSIGCPGKTKINRCRTSPK